MNPQKKIAVLGGTGSIGLQALDIIAEYPDRFRATVLGRPQHRAANLAGPSASSNLAVIAGEASTPLLRDALAPLGIETAAGADTVTDAMGATT